MAPQFIRHGSSSGDWNEPDRSILDVRRGPVPSVPLALMPQPWRDWIADTEKATGAPADYVLQSVLAGVAAVCGAGVRMRVTPAWDEPMVLWLAAVGEPAAGKSAALAPLRRMLEVIEQERRRGDEERRVAHDERCKVSGESAAFVPSQVVAAEGDLAALAEIVGGNPRGLLLWRDAPTAWIGSEEEGAHRRSWLAAWEGRGITVTRPRRLAHQLARQPARIVRHFPVSIIETSRPEPLQEQLRSGDDSVAARFLFAWPGPQPYRALEVLEHSRDEEILQRLRALSQLARNPEDPCVIEVDTRGRTALDGVLSYLHAERQKTEGPEATWLGISRSLIVRLAGALELLATIDGKARRPGTIGAEQVEAAAALWRDYYWPHAKAMFDSAELSDHSKRVRRVARWLLDRWLPDKGPTTVSREEIRRRALSLSATADEVEHVLQRLHYLGFVQPDAAYRDKPGRPTTHWMVNPALAARPPANREKPISKLA